MSDYIKKQDVIDIIHKEIESTTTFIEHNTQIDIKFAVEELPTISETEIIRKAFERVLERLERELKWTRAEQTIECERHNGYGSPLQSKNSGKIEALKKAIEIVKEECGISE